MTFTSPLSLLWLLVIPFVVAGYIAGQRKRRARSAALSAQGLVVSAKAKNRVRRHLPFALFACAIALLVIAYARPMANITTLQQQATVIVAIDVSNSMAATDVKPSRFKAAQRAATAFIHEQLTPVKIGVVAFGPSAVIVQTPTNDHELALKAVKHLSLGGGTSLSTGILTSLDAIAGKTLRINQRALANDNSGEVNIGFYGGATIVVFSDGENTAQQNPLTISRLASVAGVHVETIGVGTAAGATVHIGGFTIATALDASALKSVAKVANGSYHPASDRAGIQAVAKTIDLHLAFVSRRTEITAIFTMAAAALLAIGALLSILWFGRVI